MESSGVIKRRWNGNPKLDGAFISSPQDVARSLLDTLGAACSVDDVLCSSTVTTVPQTALEDVAPRRDHPSRATDAYELAVTELLAMSGSKSVMGNGGEERGNKADGWEMLGLPLR